MGQRTRRPLSPREAARKAAAADVCCALGGVLAHHRAAAGFSQGDLAAVVGVTQHMVSYWETGKATIGADKLLLIAARLRVPAGALLADGWADASPCARMVVPAPAGDQPGPLRWRRPPARARRAARPVEEPGGELERRLVAAGLDPDQALSAAASADDCFAPGCRVGWQTGDCPRRPTLLAVRVNRTRRWDTPARLVVRRLCRPHAEALDPRWIVVDLPPPEAEEVDPAIEFDPRARRRRSTWV